MQFRLCHFLVVQVLLLLLRLEPIVSFQAATRQRIHHEQRVTILSVKSGSTENTGTKKGSSLKGIRPSKPRNMNSKYHVSKTKKKTDGRQHTADRPNDYPPPPKDPALNETWRIYGISVHPDDLVDDDVSFSDSTGISSSSSTPPLPQSLQEAIQNKLKVLPNNLNLSNIQIVRRSLDARKKLTHPVYNYVVDISLSASQRHSLRWRPKPGRMELLVSGDDNVSVNNLPITTRGDDDTPKEVPPHSSSSHTKKTVVIVGMGPAGLFCALQLALKSNNTVRPILLDRGQPVEKRGRDIGALIHRRSLDSESNFAFGEGGAGTWSDGKLTTRIGRNSETVRWVLELLVEFGAPSNILWEGAPHLGTDNLVRLLRNMRHRLEELGGEIHFGTKMKHMNMKNGNVDGIVAEDAEGQERCFDGDAYVLATGHSARDVYESLHGSGVQLEAKGFAVGFRIEHPQSRINMIQYGTEWGACVKTGKGKTDAVNAEFFGVLPEHAGMPVPSYRLATDQASDGTGRMRGVYSFCMCPGGQIVLSSTNPEEICVNGMSFSRRDSVWANSALVVTVSPDDIVLKEYREKYGVMAGLEFQREMERKASILGGGNLTVPVQRMTDFCEGKTSLTVPPSSYRLGVKSAPCHEIFPEPITTALRDALNHHFKNQMPGYYHRDGLLHAVETRTSSPLRISRDPTTLNAVGAGNLYPCGEGAGFAGGIVSAAVDGVNVAESILDNLCGESRPNRAERAKSVGFSY